MPFGTYIIDPNRIIIFWNQAAHQISGYLSQDVIGRSCASDLISHCSLSGESLCARDKCPMCVTLQDGVPRSAVLLLRHKEGHRVRVFARTIPVRDEEGKIIAVGQVFQTESFVEGLLWGEPDVVPRSDMELSAPEHTEEQFWLHWHHGQDQLVVLLITVEKLHEMGANRGPAMVQTVLSTIAKTVANAIWVPHYLGKWTDHRFMLMVPHCDGACREEIMKELQTVTSSCRVMWWGDYIVPTVQIKAASADEFESPEALLSSLDPAWINPRLLPGDK
jgi:PAS domain S-box-containing protein